MTDLVIYTDGGSRGNPGPAAVGIVINNSSGSLVHQFAQTIGTATNNHAEYQAVIAALEWLVKNPPAPQSIAFYLDSALVVHQLNGLWKIKDSNLRSQLIQVRQLEGALNTRISYSHVPREQNTQADLLLNQALDNQAS